MVLYPLANAAAGLFLALVAALPSAAQIPPLTSSPPPELTRLLSHSTAEPAQRKSGWYPSISADGRFAAFWSYSSALVPNDTNGAPDAFVEDLLTGETTRVSISSSGEQANNAGAWGGAYPSISADGRYVAFESEASNLVSGDTNGVEDVFVHDRATGATTRVSVDSAGTQANGDSFLLHSRRAISGDGRYVVFTSDASNLVSGDTNGVRDVFVHDRTTGATTRESVGSFGTQGNDDSKYPTISSDGRFVAFVSWATNLVSGDTNGLPDVFVRDRGNSTTTRVSVSSSGVQSNGYSFYEPEMSSTGRYVVFPSAASNLVSGDTNNRWDLFLRDRQNSTTTRISVDSSGLQGNNDSYDGSISGDGRYIAFESFASNLVSGDTNGYGDVFVRDRQASTTVRVSVSSSGKQGDGSSVNPSISADGRFVAFDGNTSTLAGTGCICGDPAVFSRDHIPDPNPTTVESASDRVGLEGFYPYRSFDVGTGVASVNMDTRNLVLQSSDISVAGHGMGLTLTRTYNAVRDTQSGPLGPGWTLGLAHGEDSVGGVLSAAGGAVQALGSLDLAAALGSIEGSLKFLGAGQQFILTDSDGTTHTFVKTDTAWQPPPGISLTLTDDVDGMGRRLFRLTHPDGLRYEFRALGLRHYLTEIRDRRGNTLVVSYDPLGDGRYRLREITDVASRKLVLTWSGELITQVRFQSGSQTLDTTYAYSSGRLTSITQAAGTASARTTSYSYGSSCAMGAIICVTDPRGAITKVFGSGGKVTWISDRAGKSWDFVNCLPPVGLDTKAVCLTNPEGHTEIWTTNAAGNLVHHRDAGDQDEAGNPRRNDRSYGWEENRLRKETDEAGNTTETDYNTFGQPTETRLKVLEEPTVVTRYSYQSVPGWPGASEVTKVVLAADTPEARDETFTYFSNGSLKEDTDAEGHKTTYSYYVRGLLKSVTAPGGQTTTYGDSSLTDGGYHPSGQATRVTDSTGAAEYLSYDFLGNLTQRTDRAGKIWSFEYDLRGNRTKEIDPLGNDTWHCFDTNDNEVLTILPKQASPSCSLTETSAHVTRRTYEARDLQTSVLTSSDSQLRKTTHAYAPDAMLTEILGPRSFDGSGNLLADSSKHQRTVHVYYPNNRLKATTDGAGGQTDYTYTRSGQPEKITEPSNGTERASTSYTYTGGKPRTDHRSGHDKPTIYTYNLHGEVIASTDPKGHTTIIEYDRLGRVTKMIDPMVRTTTRGYDANGNLTSLTQPTATGEYLTTTYSYTSRGEIATESDPADPSHRIEYVYDPEGRQRFRYDRYAGAIERTIEQQFTDHGLLTRRIASGIGLESHDTTFTYDPNGNLAGSSATLAGSALSSVSATHTTANELKSWTETIAGTSKSSSYAYFSDGSIASRTTDGQTTTYNYSIQPFETQITPWGGLGSFRSEYYPSGHRKKVTFPNGAVQDETYDLGGRLFSRVVSSSAGTRLSSWDGLVYDGNDNRTAEVVTQRPANPAALLRVGTASYAYDPADRLVSAKHPFESGTSSYILDDASNIVIEGDVRSTYEANRLKIRQPLLATDVTTYTHDRLGNITSETKGSSTTNITYDAASHTRRITAPAGSWVEYAYDGFDRLVRRATSSGEITLFFRDGYRESLLLETNSSGTVKTRYVLDPAGAPLAQDVTGAPTRAYFVTDPRGNLTQLLDQNANAVATFAYDALGRDRPVLTETSSSWDSRLRYQLALWDPQTGRYTVGRRLYDPGTGRFVGIDQAVDAGGGMALQTHPLTSNRYLYAGANPIAFADNGNHPTSGQPQFKSWSISDRWGFGDLFRIGIFIRACEVHFLGLSGRGDCRRFDFNFDPARTRAAFRIDFGAGRASLRINPSCDMRGHCHGARPIGWVPHFNNHAIVWQSSSGRSLRVWWSLVQSRNPPAPFRIDGIFGVWFHGNGYFDWWTVHDAFPSYEIYWSRPWVGGQTLHRWSERGGIWGLCALRSFYWYAC